MAAFSTAACQYFSSIGSLHAFAKTVNGFSTLGMWLKCTLHIFFVYPFEMRTGRTDQVSSLPGCIELPQPFRPRLDERTAKVKECIQNSDIDGEEIWPFFSDLILKYFKLNQRAET